MRFLAQIADKIRKRAATRGFSCDCCGAELFDYPQNRLCNQCRETLTICDREKSCPKCGRATIAQGVCLSCKRALPKFDKGFSPFVYVGETAALVNRIKNGNRRLAYFFGEKMADIFMETNARFLKNDVGRVEANEKNAPEGGTGALLLILPVPAHATKVRERGYNQAADLAEIVCERLQRFGFEAEYDPDVLQKRKETKMQKHLGVANRAENVSGAYYVHKRAACRGKTIVLVDDIMTTGATGSEIAERLLGAGAKEVILLVAAALPEQK
ncbi:MAG: ComF family protein [Clostridia bacterium]|nr:ComF family protein [Clostridia bacterium]